MEAVDVRGRFVWHELMTRDTAAAKSFYSKLTGWKAQPWPLDPSYTVCHSEQGPTAGIFTITADFPAEMPAHWMGYIGTRDVDGTAAAAVRAGGSLMKGPEDIKGAGRYAILKDPQGAAFAVLDPENARAETQGVPPLGTFSWHELATTDHEAAFAFYSELFGWDAITRMEMPGGGTYLIFGRNGVQRGGIYIKSDSTEGPPFWLPYAHVPNADGAAKTAAGMGGKVITEPMDVPGGGRISIFIDPSGAAFAVHSMGVATGAPEPKPAAKPKAAPAAKPKPKAPAAQARPAAKSKTKTKAKAKKKAGAATRKPMKKAAPKKKAAKKSAPRRAGARQKSKSVRRKK
jgi:predicted enzyme related to lactoylglutathione lyase